MNCPDIETLRQCNVGGFVIFDHIVTLFAAYIVSQVFNVSIIFAFVIVIVIWIGYHYQNEITAFFNSNIQSDTKSADTKPADTKPVTTEVKETEPEAVVPSAPLAIT